MKATHFTLTAVSALLATVLAGCGGGGGGAGGVGTRSLSDAPGDLGASAQYANQCAVDNTLAHSSSGDWLEGYRKGSRQTEQQFIRAYMQESYLWYADMPQVNGQLPEYLQVGHEEGMQNYFRALLSPKLTARGARKDRFSFAMPTAEWKASSQAGTASGYGVDLGILKNEVPRDVRVLVVHEGTPAAQQGVSRGDMLVAVTTASGKRIDVVNTQDAAEVEELNRVLFSANDGEKTGFELKPVDTEQPNRQTVLSAGEYQKPPVQTASVITTDDGAKIGYLQFNGFTLPVESQLLKAVTDMKNQQVQDVVVDLRYNGGGYLYQSAQLAYMLSDTSLTQGKVFERLQYNDKRRRETEASQSQMRFMSQTTGTEGTGTKAGQSLPNLGLKRVYVLTSNSTCSASESLINGLRGVDVEVVQIGNTTCGKPYGFTAKDNCGMSYFPIEFDGVNDKGVGGFDAGFTPNCMVADDVTHQLGDVKESLLAAALHYRQHGSCPASSATVQGKQLGATGADGTARPAGRIHDPRMVRSPALTNKFLLP